MLLDIKKRKCFSNYRSNFLNTFIIHKDININNKKKKDLHGVINKEATGLHT
jgi:hypothetical protein